MEICVAQGACSLGQLHVAITTYGICRVSLADDANPIGPPFWHLGRFGDSAPAARQALSQVAGYIDSGCRTLRPLLDVHHGTAFQRRVWQALQAIPRGSTQTYGQLAAALGSPAACRAVAAACGANPVAVLIPCHRVVGASGKLTGYRWGLARKAALLHSEQDGG